jgi:two-component sensor histidine kinase/CHASE1-domain containing sensor protein
LAVVSTRDLTPRRFSASRRLPLIVLLLGILSSVAAASGVQRLAAAKDEERFANVVAQTHGQIEARLQTYTAVLRAAAGLFAAKKGEVEQEEFRAFADRLDLPGTYPGIQGLGFSAALPDHDGPRTRVLLTRLGVPGLRPRQEQPSPEVHAIVFLEPMDRRNRAAIGYDMYSNPIRREAMARARDTGRSAMSGKVRLVQEIDEEKQAGFLIYHPVYRGGGVPDGIEERRAQLMGFAYSPFRADDLLRGIFGDQPAPRVSFEVYDREVRPENLLHSSRRGGAERRALKNGVRELTIGGRTWRIVYHSTPAFERSSSRGLAPGFLFGGLLATVLLTGATSWQVRARVAAENEIAARRAVEQQRELLIAELNHRVKNTLATVQSIASQTLREGAGAEEIRASFESRLLALSQAHDLLTRDSWRGARLAELVQMELAPYGRPDQVRVHGDEVLLTPNTAVALAMALHELATNAAKYGSLSTADGSLSVSWETREQTGQPWLHLLWQEGGGPPVEPPTRRGFGTRLIETGLKRQLHGRVELEFAPQGVRCRIEVPLERHAERRA